jgi:hypothetical protein
VLSAAVSAAASAIVSAAASAIVSDAASAVVSAAAWAAPPEVLPVEAELQAAMEVTIAASVIPVIKNLNFLLISFAFIS